MKGILKKSLCILLCLCLFPLYGCVPSFKFLNEKKQGKYPDTGDFPNTKWVCREINMCFYMLDYEERYMIGTYVVNDTPYRVVSAFEFDELNFDLYSTTQISPSEYSNGDDNTGMVHCERVSCGYMYTNYSYKNNTIVCSLRGYQSVDGEVLPTTLTFDKTETIAQNAAARWYAQELDMYLDSFSDVEGYYRGEIGIGEKECYVHAFEIGNNGYFMLSIENGKVNNLISGTTSPLICMYFELHENQIIAKVSDEFVSNSLAFPYWDYTGATITFKPVSPLNSCNSQRENLLKQINKTLRLSGHIQPRSFY